MIQVILVLILIGVLMYAVERLIPMDAQIKMIIRIVILIAIILWLLQVFGVTSWGFPGIR